MLPRQTALTAFVTTLPPALSETQRGNTALPVQGNGTVAERKPAAQTHAQNPNGPKPNLFPKLNTKEKNNKKVFTKLTSMQKQDNYNGLTTHAALSSTAQCFNRFYFPDEPPHLLGTRLVGVLQQINESCLKSSQTTFISKFQIQEVKHTQSATHTAGGAGKGKGGVARLDCAPTRCEESQLRTPPGVRSLPDDYS